jgi:DNA polymerase/3'-5' exonuclease PolX
MSQGKSFPLEIAKLHAGIYLAAVMPFCERAMIVGSVRRSKPEVHDIELLIIPQTTPKTDLFGTVVGSISAFEMAFSALAKSWGARVVMDGPRNKKLITSEHIPLEIYVSDCQRWGVETVIKTGPKDFSERCVTIKQHAGYLPSNCEIKDGWKVYRGQTVIPMPDEKDFLDFLGLGWLEPEKRK